MSRRFWVVSVIQRLDAMEFGTFNGIPIRIKTPDEPYSYLPVFESREAAVAWNGGPENIYEMQEPAHD